MELTKREFIVIGISSVAVGTKKSKIGENGYHLIDEGGIVTLMYGVDRSVKGD